MPFLFKNLALILYWSLCGAKCCVVSPIISDINSCSIMNTTIGNIPQECLALPPPPHYYCKKRGNFSCINHAFLVDAMPI